MKKTHNIIHCNNVIMQYNTPYSALIQNGPHTPWTLGPLSLDINRGEKIALVGKSGSGKTSFLRLLQSGGKNINDTLSYTGIRNTHGANIMSIFQEPKAVLSPLKTVYTAFKHLAYSKKYPHTTPLSKQDIAEYLNTVGLDNVYEVMNKRPYQLSGGMAQKVMIALVLVMNAEVVLADEVSSSLDRESEKTIMDFLIERFETMIIATHKLHLITEQFPRIIFFEEGKILFDGVRTAFLQSSHPSIQMYRENLMLLDKKYKGE